MYYSAEILADLLSMARETSGTRTQEQTGDGNPDEGKELRWRGMRWGEAPFDSPLRAAARLVLDAGAGITGGVSTVNLTR
jgi:hypothetical protein